MEYSLLPDRVAATTHNAVIGFDEMPIELLATIFCRLDEEAKKVCRLVAVKWKDVLDRFFFKFKACLSDNTFENILTSGVQFDTLLVRDFSREITADEDILGNLQLAPATLIFKHNRYITFDQDDTPSVLPMNVVRIIQLNPDIKTLVFERNTLTNLDFPLIQDICLNNLTKLEINLVSDHNPEEKTVLESLYKIHMPRVAELRVNAKIMHSDYNTDVKQKFYLDLFCFVSKFHASLRCLTFLMSFGLIPTPRLRIVRLNAPPATQTSQLVIRLSPKDEKFRREKLEKIRLLKFSFMFSKNEGYMHYDFGFSLLEAQSQLTNLDFHFEARSSELISCLERVISRCKDTLQIFSISNHGCAVLPLSSIESVLNRLIVCQRLHSLAIDGYNVPSFRHCCPALSIASFQFNGSFGPELLLEIPLLFPKVENLSIAHNDNMEVHRLEDLATNLKLLVTMPRLVNFKWKLQRFDFVEFMKNAPNLTIVKVHQYIDYYSVVIRFDGKAGVPSWFKIPNSVLQRVLTKPA